MSQTLWTLLAQTVIPDAISGGAGWAGAGLLGLVLGWLLLKHLPEKDAQLAAKDKAHSDQLDAKDENYLEQIKTLHAECTSERKEQFAEFQRALNVITERSSKDSDRTLTAMQLEMQNLRAAIQTLGKAVDALTNVEKHRE